MDYTATNFSVTPNSPEYKDLEFQPGLNFSDLINIYVLNTLCNVKFLTLVPEQYVKDTEILKEKC